jgi:hypothetical protein
MTELLQLIQDAPAPFVLVLGVVAGADLGIALVVLALAPYLGWPSPPGHLADLQAPAAVVSALALYLVEWSMERSPWSFALWHTFHRWVRVLAIGLVCFMALGDQPAAVRLALGIPATLLGTAVYMVFSGWAGAMILREVSFRSQQISSLAMDVAFGAVLVLAMEEPVQGLAAAGALLLIAVPKLPLWLRAHGAVIHAGRGWLHRFQLPGSWTPGPDLPTHVLEGLGELASLAGASLRGAPARLLTRDLRSGWMVVGAGHAWFVDRRGRVSALRAEPGSGARSGRLQVRKPVLTETGVGELLVSRDGPEGGELDREIPRGVPE